MRVGFLIAFYKESTDDGCQKSCCRKQKRENSTCCLIIYDTKGDRRYQGANIGLEQVSAHAGNVAYVITYVISDNSRVSRVILRDACLNLTYQVSTYVSSLRINTAANTGKQSDGRCAKAEAGQNVHVLRYHVNSAYTQHTQTGHTHTHNSAAGESDG